MQNVQYTPPPTPPHYQRDALRMQAYFQAILQNLKSEKSLGYDTRFHFFHLQFIPAALSLTLIYNPEAAQLLPLILEALEDETPIRPKVISTHALPASGHGELAIIKAPLVPLRKEPSHRSEMLNQAIYGHWVEVLYGLTSHPNADFHGIFPESWSGWALVRMPDGYLGWLETRSLQHIPAGKAEAWVNKKYQVLTQTAIMNGNQPLPMGALVTQDSAERFNSEIMNLVQPSPWPNILKPNSLEGLKALDKTVFVQTALQFMGAPYLWGGVSIFGIDCSGLVQVAAFSQGMLLPRDADLQSQLGEPLYISPEEWQAGDLVFFGTERITHVGIATGANTFLHADWCVQVNALDPQLPNFAPERLATYKWVVR